jgi:hypothetical protein
MDLAVLTWKERALDHVYIIFECRWKIRQVIRDYIADHDYAPTVRILRQGVIDTVTLKKMIYFDLIEQDKLRAIWRDTFFIVPPYTLNAFALATLK